MDGSLSSQDQPVHKQARHQTSAAEDDVHGHRYPVGKRRIVQQRDGGEEYDLEGVGGERHAAGPERGMGKWRTTHDHEARQEYEGNDEELGEGYEVPRVWIVRRQLFEGEGIAEVVYRQQ